MGKYRNEKRGTGCCGWTAFAVLLYVSYLAIRFLT